MWITKVGPTRIEAKTYDAFVAAVRAELLKH